MNKKKIYKEITNKFNLSIHTTPFLRIHNLAYYVFLYLIKYWECDETLSQKCCYWSAVKLLKI